MARRILPMVLVLPFVIGWLRLKGQDFGWYGTEFGLVIFATFNVIGGLLWGAGLTTLGHFLGDVTWVKNNIEIASVGIIALSLVPIALEVLRHRRQAATAELAGAPGEAGTGTAPD